MNLKTTEYLYRYQHRDWTEDMLYRYLDKLHYTQKDTVQKISFEHPLKISGNDISMVFYDVTTLLPTFVSNRNNAPIRCFYEKDVAPIRRLQR